jgi:hypothetical protein
MSRTIRRICEIKTGRNIRFIEKIKSKKKKVISFQQVNR